MFVVLTGMIGIVIVFSAASSYRRTRDPLAPMVIFMPMLGYVYAYHPLALLPGDQLEPFFPGLEGLLLVQALNLAAISAFCLGCNWHRVKGSSSSVSVFFSTFEFTPAMRSRLLTAGYFLAAISLFVFASKLWVTDPKVFTYRKPFLSSPIRSGYYSELVNLSFLAVILVACAWQGRKFTGGKFLALVTMLSPILFLGTVCGRRGPLFLSIVALGGCYFIIRRIQPTIRLVVSGVILAGVMMLLLQFNRGIFRPWEVDQREVVSFTAIDRAASGGDEFVVASALILTSIHYNRFYLGMRYFVQFLVRPIPRQIWPTKYEDLGMSWMVDAPGSAGITESEWADAVGFLPFGGSAPGFVADLFLEFSFLAILACFAIGYFYSYVWKRSKIEGGFWMVFYLQLVILSVYLPSQSLGAWLYRLIMLAVPSWIIWKFVIQPRLLARRIEPYSKSDYAAYPFGRSGSRLRKV